MNTNSKTKLLEGLFFLGCDKIQAKKLDAEEELEHLTIFAKEMKEVRQEVFKIFEVINSL